MTQLGTGQLGTGAATAAIDAAAAKAGELGVAVSIAVVDAGGNLVAFLRMDGAEIAGPTLAVDKAYTAVANRISTADLTEEAAPGGPLFGLHACGGGRFVIFGGGVPVWSGDTVAGAVGVSGATVDQDASCAEAGRAGAESVLNDATERRD